MKHKPLIIFFALFLLSSLFLKTEAFGKSPFLEVNELSLFMNEGHTLKIKGLPRGSKLKFSPKDKTVCTVSKKGRIKALLPGETEVKIKVLTKGEEKTADLKLMVKVSSTFLARSQKDLEKAHLSKKVERVLLKPKKNGSFRLPKGRLGYSLLLLPEKEDGKLNLSVEKGSFLREIELLGGKKVKLTIKEFLPSLILGKKSSDISLITSEKNGLITSLQLKEELNLKADFRSGAKDKNGTKLYLSKKGSFDLKGRASHPLSVYVFEEAAESEIKSELPIQLFTSAPSLFTVLKNAKKSTITTLNYKVPVTVDNKTSSELSINTPSLIKTVPAMTRKTITGK